MTSALIVIDMLNPYEHQDAEPLMESVEQALPAMRELIEEAPEAGLLTVYVNDNHGDWTAGREKLTRRALAGAAPTLIEPIAPPDRAAIEDEGARLLAWLRPDTDRRELRWQSA